MSTPTPDPGAVPAAVSGPVPGPAPAEAPGERWTRISDIVDGIVFYGLLLFGLSIPVIGAVYAFLHR